MSDVKRPKKQTGAHDEHEREDDLRHDEAAGEARLSFGAGRSAAPLCLNASIGAPRVARAAGAMPNTNAVTR